MDLVTLLPAVARPAVNIPIWNQYVDLLVLALNWLASLFHSSGLAIIAFTIIVKTVMLPLTVQSIRSSKAMQELQPKIKELQKKHGKDRQRLTQETMALYQQYRVNPMAGCLPRLLQIPIFLGLYNAILHLSNEGTGVWNDSFLWIPDLSQPDALHILPIMAAVFQFVQTKMMRPSGMGKIDDPQQAMMNTMMNFMPLTVILFGWNFAAGPVIYWATQSIYSVIQQWFITGWGSLKDWAPMLPEMPEHKRLGYRPPRSLDDVVVVGGEGGRPVKAGGISGWFQTQMEKAQQMSAQAQTPQPRAEEAEPARAEGGKGTGGGSASGKAVIVQRKGAGGQDADGGAANGAATNGNGSATANGAAAGNAVVVPRKAKQATEPGGKRRR
ncbi:MAG: membrane protein insertase YidC [Thermomicrobiales bacterium]|nr:membrane protein insertase YidC [Thermomicrobiales bacterium]